MSSSNSNGIEDLNFLTKFLLFLYYRIVSRSGNLDLRSYNHLTVGENIIATTKIRNNYGAIQSFTFLYCSMI